MYFNSVHASETRKIVVKWYEDNYANNEIKLFNYDLSKKKERIKLITLGIFFNCIFQERKALEIFSAMDKHGFLEMDCLDNFEVNLKNTMHDLGKKTGNSYGILKIQNMIDSVNSLKQIFNKEDDICGLIREKGVEGFIRFMYEELFGIKAKLLWICRECRGYFHIPDKYCYVPDSHVVKFLYNTGLTDTKRTLSLEECIEISSKMALFLGNKYFDLPYMRYHQEKCKRCKKDNTVQCELSCKLNKSNKQQTRLI